MSTALFGMCLLLCTSAIFSGAEAALFTLAAEGKQNRQTPALARRLLADQAAVLTTILMANLVANLSYFAATHHWAAQFSTRTEAMIEILGVLGIVLFGEIFPKVLAHRFPRFSGQVLLVPVVVLHGLLGPVSRLFCRHDAAQEAANHPLDSTQAASLLEQESKGGMDSDEQELIRHLLELGQLRAGALRRPLAEVPTVRAAQTLPQALAEMKQLDAAWAVVMEDEGEVLGVLDRARLPQGGLVHEAMKPIPVLPEVAAVANGVQQLPSSGSPCVLLVDEYGSSVGIIQRGRWADTLLDRLPRYQESDPAPIRLDSHGQWEVAASLPLHDFHDRFGDPGLADVRVDTVGGLVAEKLGRMAKLGDRVVLEKDGRRFVLEVRDCSDTRILWLGVKVEALPAPDFDGDKEEPKGGAA